MCGTIKRSWSASFDRGAPKCYTICMGIITGLSPQKKIKDRFNLYVDGEFLCGINLESIVKHHLKEGAEIDGQALLRAVLESDCTDAFERGADYVSRGRRTEAEMKKYLLSKGYSEEVADFALEKLKSYRYVDDGEWLSSYFSYNVSGKGRFKIRQELKLRGIPDELAEERLAAFSEDPEEAEALGRKFMRGRVFDQKSKAALWRHLSGKGYERDTVSRAVSAIFRSGEFEE